jgi:putative component of toxin-antitoxin plasmid stabilization module
MSTGNDDGKPFALEFYEEGGRRPVLDWLKEDLTADQRQELGAAMSEVLQVHGSAVCSSEFGKRVDSDIFYFRLRTRTGDIFRVYCHEYDGAVVLLLHAYDKGSRVAKSWEAEQIRTARRRFTAWVGHRARAAKDAQRAGADARSKEGSGPTAATRRRRQPSG